MILKLKQLNIVALFCLVMTLGTAQSTKIDVKKISDSFYFDLKGIDGAISNYYELDSGAKTKNFVFNYQSGGYVLVSRTETDIKILGFSETGEYRIEGSPLEDVLLNNYKKVEVYGEPSQFKSQKAKILSKTQGTINPILNDVWGGVNCFDDLGAVIYPSNYYTPSHCSPGCVAISLSQILYHYKWPKKGAGSNVYSENYNGSLKRHAAHFDNIEYDWANMLDEYRGKPSTDMQRKAVGELMYSAGVALQMNYEPSGSTSNINKTPFVYEIFFRFTSHYEDASWSSFWQRLYDNIQSGFPVPVAVDASRTGDGHVFIVNGYKEIGGQPYYHLNWGWYNDNSINGWYNIQAWTRASPGYNTITGASFDLLPNPQITSIVKIGSGNDFTVNWETSAVIISDEFTIEQKIDQGNWVVLATGVTANNYTINNPAGEVYQFRVKSKIDGSYYANSWSEVEVFAVDGGFDGYADFGGLQYAYARQTPDIDLDFSSDYTFETWIKLKDANSNGNVLIDQQNVFGLEISNVTASDYAITFKSHSSGATLTSDNSGGNILNNEWVHVAVTHAANTTRLFINGMLRHENTSSNFNFSSSNSTLNIAERYHGSYSGKIKANLDQLRISSSARYITNFTPVKATPFEVDVNTIAYFNFQNVHSVRLKDEAHNLSVIVKNDINNTEWNFEKTSNSLGNEDFELLKSTFKMFPNPSINNTTQISFDAKQNLEGLQISLFDVTGRKTPVTIHKNTFNTWKLFFNKASSGVYILQVKGEGFIASKKIFIQ